MSRILLIPVAVLSRLRDERLSADEERELAYWLHVANARGRSFTPGGACRRGQPERSGGNRHCERRS